MVDLHMLSCLNGILAYNCTVHSSGLVGVVMGHMTPLEIHSLDHVIWLSGCGHGSHDSIEIHS